MDPERAVSSTIPARLDALPWSRWHWRVVLALGVTWLLDGLEVTVVGSLGAALQRPEVLGLSAREVGLSGSAYIAGAVPGALVFGRLADRWGRKRLFLITLGVYLAGTVATAFAFDFASFALLRFVTGFGIGGEYAAINSAIDELIPARVRGAVDLAINGTFWIGAALGAALSLVLLDPRFFPPALGWRLAFGLGAVLGLAMLLVRRHVPESPRWLIVHGRVAQAEAELTRIEAEVAARARRAGPPRSRALVGDAAPAAVVARDRAAAHVALSAARAARHGPDGIAGLLLQRDLLHLCARAGALLRRARSAGGPLHLPIRARKLPRSAAARPALRPHRPPRDDREHLPRCGPRALARGRAVPRGRLDATSQALCWAAIFFVASAAASSAYLTVSEIFPLEIRAISISIFYALGTGVGGFLGPALFAELIEAGSRDALFAGYVLAAARCAGPGSLRPGSAWMRSGRLSRRSRGRSARTELLRHRRSEGRRYRRVRVSTPTTRLAERALRDEPPSEAEARWILDAADVELLPLLHAAYVPRRRHFGNQVMVHVLNNVQNGLCPEDCGYCSQNRDSKATIQKYAMKSEAEILAEAEHAARAGATRYCMVLSGRGPTLETTRRLAAIVRKVKERWPIEVCLSVGLLEEEHARVLAEAGLDRLNHNLNTSERHYERVCSTHTYADRVRTLRAAKACGIEPCSGLDPRHGRAQRGSDRGRLPPARARGALDPRQLPRADRREPVGVGRHAHAGALPARARA